jgi:hypothetical protein
MRSVRSLFYLAAAYGFVVLTPQYFLEERFSRDNPPAITHPEFYYAFIGVALAFQIVFAIIGRDPVRYRPMMLAGVVEKFSFGIAAPLLYSAGRVQPLVLVFSTIDLLFGLAFLAAWWRLRGQRTSL